MPEGTNENTAPEGQSKSVETSSTEELRSLNDKLYAEVRSLRDENKDRRLKSEGFEKAEQERLDAEMSEVDKLKKENAKVAKEFDDFKVATAQKNLASQFTSAVTEAGLPAKIAKIAVPSDLSEDNMKERAKEAIKEFSEFVKTEEKKETKPSNPFASVQPKPNSGTGKAPTGKMDAVTDEFLAHINREK